MNPMPKVLCVDLPERLSAAIQARFTDIRIATAADTYDALDLCLQTTFDTVIASTTAEQMSDHLLSTALASNHYQARPSRLVVIDSNQPTLDTLALVCANGIDPAFSLSGG